MVSYLDTSVLIPLLVHEPSSDRVHALLKKTPAIYLSRWTQTEFVSAMAQKVRLRECTTTGFANAVAQLKKLIDDNFNCVTPLEEDYLRANIYMQTATLGLRAGDALHLAISARLETRLLTLDKAMVKAAQHFKLVVKAP